MKKTSTLSNDNLFYKKSRGLLEVALWMQEQENGVSIKDMMETLKVSRRTAIRIKDSIKNWFPQIQEMIGENKMKYWSIPSGTIALRTATDPKPVRDTFQTKLEDLFNLAKKEGYKKLTDKQVMIAYYGKYTTQNKTDRKTLSEIREGLSKLQSPYKELIDKNE